MSVLATMVTEKQILHTSSTVFMKQKSVKDHLAWSYHGSSLRSAPWCPEVLRMSTPPRVKAYSGVTILKSSPVFFNVLNWMMAFCCFQHAAEGMFPSATHQPRSIWYGASRAIQRFSENDYVLLQLVRLCETNGVRSPRKEVKNGT